ncbi:hypothetical protein [Halococcus saccharolyticus]|uniref:GINS subunit domain-containing protein n=1 Tax=Halococcus saccharolyticus DSM 5350 TaxID=1227455 RepID=M0MDP1_9EURY|nr:hypothetical protein [Halococcus saccharolyticus]EMA43448.1 hypothetical protein C449_15777 [Halococcus saccharolyticus DSM 5350]
MNLGDLQSARSKERQKDSLQHLREEFYAEVGAFVEELRTERERAAAAADDPFSAPEVRRLTDDIETAENTVEAIYERRVGKLVKLASLDAAGMPADEDGLTSEERELFETLVESIESNRAHVLDDVLAGDEAASDDGAETDSPTPPDGATGPAPTDGGGAAGVGSDDSNPAETGAAVEPAGTAEPDGGIEASDGTTGRTAPGEAEGGVTAADAMGGTADTTADASTSDKSPTDEPPTDPDRAPAGATDTGSETAQRATDDTDRTTVRITRDVGEIMGVDERTYHLASEDVVTLPEVNATPLLERDAAEQLE